MAKNVDASVALEEIDAAICGEQGTQWS